MCRYLDYTNEYPITAEMYLGVHTKMKQNLQANLCIDMKIRCFIANVEVGFGLNKRG